MDPDPQEENVPGDEKVPGARIVNIPGSLGPILSNEILFFL